MLSYQQSAPSTLACTHRWRVAAPVGDQCVGTCCLCGAERQFTNERRPFGQAARTHRPAGKVGVATVTPGVAALCARIGAKHEAVASS